jgi:hypothetical protein
MSVGIRLQLGQPGAGRHGEATTWKIARKVLVGTARFELATPCTPCDKLPEMGCNATQ